MALFRWLARGFLLNRLLRSRRPPAPPSGYRSDGSGRAFPPQYRTGRRGRVGLFGPFPYYSTTTRRGARVSVGGCCLPIPLFFLATMLTASLLVGRRLVRRTWG
ncbi:MAG: hypothetical protein ACR2JO_03045 [Mycobacteriales bacterium]